MADDDTGDWLSAATEEEPPPPPEPKKKTKKGKAKAAGAEAAPEEVAEAPPAEGEPEERPEAEPEYLDPNKLLLFKHWIRPKFLQYKYMYDYRHNYYDDVIDYLDKRMKGFGRDIPRAQTWAERVLRTYNSKINKHESFRKTLEDTVLVEKSRLSGAFFHYHSREYINRRYSSLL